MNYNVSTSLMKSALGLGSIIKEQKAKRKTNQKKRYKKKLSLQSHDARNIQILFFKVVTLTEGSFFTRKSGRTTQAISMLEKCIWLQPRFVQALVELLTLTPDCKKQPLLRKLLVLEPLNWEHYVMYGNWFKEKG